MIDETNGRLAISYRSKKLLYVSIFQLHSWDKINDYKFDERVELYNSYYTDNGTTLFANIDLYKLVYLKINLLNGEVDTLQCKETPRGCNRTDMAVYKTTVKTSDNLFMIMVDDQHSNDVLIYLDQFKYNTMKSELEKSLNKTVSVVDVRDKIENDARKKYGTFKPVVQQTPGNAIQKQSIILTKDNILSLLDNGTYENEGVVLKLDDDAKKTVKEIKEKNSGSGQSSSTGEQAGSKPVSNQSTGEKTLSDSRFEVGEVIKLNNILFEQGKSNLLPESFKELDKLASILKTRTTMEIQVNGHTNNIGLQNLEISEKRAKAVVDYLQSKGINAARLKYHGYGDTKPIESNDTEEGRTRNRRVEIYIIKR
jgi:outer membrane protein OmpA-like peptidoglycan-associated protein